MVVLSRFCCGSNVAVLRTAVADVSVKRVKSCNSVGHLLRKNKKRVCYSSLSQELKPEWCRPLKEGDAIPLVTFRTRVRNNNDEQNPFDWKAVTTKDLFQDKRCVLFCVPGAFTPTCSSSHLPGYENSYDDFKALGIDEVYCLAVNDAFVMRQWGLQQGLKDDKTPGSLGFTKVKLIPDGACHFTRGMGMSCLWDSERGFGEKSWRYSALIEDQIIQKLFIEGGAIEQNSASDPFQVSDADTMLHHLQSL